MCLNDVLQSRAVAVHTITDSITCRHEKLFGTVWIYPGEILLIMVYTRLQVYERVGILLVELYEREGKSVILG